MILRIEIMGGEVGKLRDNEGGGRGIWGSGSRESEWK